MSRAGTPIAPETREVILDLRARGLSDEAIGERVGRTASSVRHVIAQARDAGDPRARYLSEEAKRQRIVAAWNAPTSPGRSGSARGGGGFFSMPAAAPPSSAGGDAPAEAASDRRSGVSPRNCAAGGETPAAAFSVGRRKAYDDAKPVSVPNPKMRRCLGCCGEMFASRWSGHRICDRCRSSEGAGAWR